MAATHSLPQEVSHEISEELWASVGGLPCSLSVEVPLRSFTVRELLELQPGAILESKSAEGVDVPFLVNTQLAGWAEFEVMGPKLAIRLTELA